MVGFGMVVRRVRLTGWGPVAAQAARLVSQETLASVMTAGALGLAVATLAFGAYYAITRTPLVFLPHLVDVPVVGRAVKALPPQYIFAISGAVAPFGVALSPDGERVYVTESEGQRLVLVFDREGKALGSLAPPGTGPQERLPVYVAVDKDDTVYVTDRLRRTVDRYGPDGVYLGPLYPEALSDLAPNPLGLAVEGTGALYLTDVSPGRHQVMVLALSEGGRLQMAFGKEGKREREFSYPNGLAVAEDGALYVSDGNNARVLVFDAGGALKGGVTQGEDGPLSLPRGLALDRAGRLYVVDAVEGMVHVYDTRQDPPALLFAFGESGRGDGQLNYPNGIAVDSSAGRVYVADWANHRVSVWAY